MAMLGLVGGLMGAAGSLIGGFGQYEAQKYNAQVAANNAQIYAEKANYAIQAGQQAAAVQSMKNAEQYAKIKTGLAAGGIDVNSGSAVKVGASQRELGSLETATTFQNAKLEQYADLVQATGAQAQSQVLNYEAPFSLAGGALGAAGQAFGAAGKWYTGTTTST